MLVILWAALTGCIESDFTLNLFVQDNRNEPDILVNPSSLYFSPEEVGTRRQQTVDVRNIGDARLEISAISIAGDGYTLKPLRTPLTLAPGEVLPVVINHTMRPFGQPGSLLVYSNDPDTSPAIVEISSLYLEPRLEVEPRRLDFGPQLLGCTDEATVTLRSVGDAPVSLEEITLSAEGPFALLSTPEVSVLAPGEETTVTLQFSTEIVGDAAASLRVASDDPRGVQTATLQGMGDQNGTCAGLEVSLLIQNEIVDVAFLVDTTTSMAPFVHALSEDFAEIADQLSEDLDDITFGVAFHRDYGPPIGSAQDLPFVLRVPQTQSTSQVRQALQNIQLRGGGYDQEEAQLEALFQAMSGHGYDQGCDGEFDAETDVRPFLPAPTDAFSGAVSGASPGASLGQRGGMGFREDALPIVLLATDAPFREPPDSPGSCGQDAGMQDVQDAQAALGALIVGVGVSMDRDERAQLAQISDFSVQWTAGDDLSIRDIISDALVDLINQIVYDEVWLEVVSDPGGQVRSVEPARWADVRAGQDVTFLLMTDTAIADTGIVGTYPVDIEIWGRLAEAEYLLKSQRFYVFLPEE